MAGTFLQGPRVSGSKFEPGTSRMEVKAVIVLANVLGPETS